MYNLPRLSQEEIENLDRPIISNEIEPVILKFQVNKSLGPVASQVNSTKHLEKS